MCMKASRNLQALPCVAPYMDLSKKSFFDECIRLIYNEKQMTFEKLFEQDGSISLIIQNLQTLGREVYKVVYGGFPKIVMEIFRIREENEYNLTHQNTFKRLIVNSVYNGTEIFRLCGLKSRNLFLQKLRK